MGWWMVGAAAIGAVATLLAAAIGYAGLNAGRLRDAIAGLSGEVGELRVTVGASLARAEKHEEQDALWHTENRQEHQELYGRLHTVEMKLPRGNGTP